MAEPVKYGGVIPDDLEDLKNVAHAASPQVGDTLTVTAVDANGRVHWEAATGTSGSGAILDSQIPASIARDSEVAAAVTAHVGATDPHADRAYTDTRLAALVDSAPDLLNTLGEIATALQNDESAAAALTSAVAAKAPLASPTFTGIATAPVIAASGLTGATTASRYVGATTGGPPVAGTFAVNDWVVTPTGISICTVAGSPGTWQPAGPGFELAIDKAVASETRTGATANASMSDQVQISFPCPASAFIVEGWAFQGSVATAGGRGQLTLASPDLASIYAIDTVTSAASGDVDTLRVQTRLTAADLGVAVGATVTFELFKKVFNSAQTFTITATALTPIVLRAVTVL